MSERENKAENPYESPQVGDAARNDDRTIVNGDVTLLRRSLIGFGFFAVAAQILVAIVTEHLVYDIFAMVIAAYATGITRQSFEKLPLIPLLLLLYPLQFVSMCFSSEVLELHTWLVPARQPYSPLGLYLILAIWGSANAVFVLRFYRLQRDVQLNSPKG